MFSLHILLFYVHNGRLLSQAHCCACCALGAVQGRRKSGVSDCPVCEEEKRKRLECSDGSNFIVYYYGNASETKVEQEQEQAWDSGKEEWDSVKEESPVSVAADSSPPLVARASSVIYYSQASLE